MEGYRMANVKVRRTILEAEQIKSSIFRITQAFTDDETQRVENGNSREKMIMGYLCIKEQIEAEQMEAMKRRDEIDEIISIIAETNEEHAEILKSRYCASMNPDQIADELYRSKPTVKRKLAAALDSVALVLSMRGRKSS